MARPEARIAYSVPFPKTAVIAERTQVPNFSTALLSGEAILVGGKFVLEYARVPAKGKKKGYKGKVLIITDPNDQLSIGRNNRAPEPVDVSSAAATSPFVIRTLSNGSITVEVGNHKLSLREVIASYPGGFALKVDSSAPFSFERVGWRAKVPGLREILRRRLEQPPSEK